MKKTKLVNNLMLFLAIIGLCLYTFTIISAAINPSEDTPPSFLRLLVTSLGAILATNIGAVMGIAVQNPDKPNVFRDRNTYNLKKLFTEPDSYKIRVFASYFYVIALLIGLVSWGIKGFAENSVSPIIEELSRTLLGVILGVMSFYLTPNED